jgi:hypothetical protein
MSDHLTPARLGAVLLALAGWPGAAAAQQGPPSTGGAAIGALFDALGVRKPSPPAEDFVRDSRPAQLDYLPLAPTPEKTAPKTAAQLQAAGAALDRAGAEARRRAARVKIPD